MQPNGTLILSASWNQYFFFFHPLQWLSFLFSNWNGAREGCGWGRRELFVINKCFCGISQSLVALLVICVREVMAFALLSTQHIRCECANCKNVHSSNGWSGLNGFRIPFINASPPRIKFINSFKRFRTICASRQQFHLSISSIVCDSAFRMWMCVCTRIRVEIWKPRITLKPITNELWLWRECVDYQWVKGWVHDLNLLVFELHGNSISKANNKVETDKKLLRLGKVDILLHIFGQQTIASANRQRSMRHNTYENKIYSKTQISIIVRSSYSVVHAVIRLFIDTPTVESSSELYYMTSAVHRRHWATEHV